MPKLFDDVGLQLPADNCFRFLVPDIAVIAEGASDCVVLRTAAEIEAQRKQSK
ncbi:MAG TPA: hypothetical protein VJZ94_01570 [Candidatus Paceibacterota bacterium]|nr:MAG: hypothetical protein UY78_C0017G0008 [Parcubacteria group bacterium GW2011_GWA1_53_13]HXK31413.1 hypothetical protein [Candidatus Paceibacterota bacterium]